MLKLTLQPGEFIQIGENVRVVYSGGSAGNIHLLVEAPREINIARNKAMERRGTMPQGKRRSYQAEPQLSEEAKEMIGGIIASEYRRQRKRGERV